MNLASLLTPERTSRSDEVTSKKRALEFLSDRFSESFIGLSSDTIFDHIMERERLGSTGLGKGVALPHCRLAGVEAPAISLLLLKKPIKYDAPDARSVDLLAGLVVPHDSNDQHLQILAKLAEMLADERLTERLRGATTSQAVYELIVSWGAAHS